MRPVHTTRRVLAATAAVLAARTVIGSPRPANADHGGTPVATPANHGAVGGGTGAAYATIRNGGAESDRLLDGATDVAEVVEVHEAAAGAGDVMTMRPLPDGLEIPAGGEVTLEPGGYHLMLVGLREDLTPGKRFDLTLRFERAGEVTVPVDVRTRPSPASADDAPSPVMAGDLTIDAVWSRPAPALLPSATPGATPTH